MDERNPRSDSDEIGRTSDEDVINSSQDDFEDVDEIDEEDDDESVEDLEE